MTKLQDAEEKLSEISLPGVDSTDDASWDEWNERVRARSNRALEAEQRRLQELGLIDEHWNARTDQLPDDMLPSSTTSVEA